MVVYTSVEEFNFHPLWVDGSRSSAGHCCLWPWGATWSDVLFRIAASDGCRGGSWDAVDLPASTRYGGYSGIVLPDYLETCTGVSRFAPLHSNCTPLRGRSRCTAVFPGVSVLSKPTPALSKCLKLKCHVTSQAGRRGFDPRLPLQSFQGLSGFHLKPPYLVYLENPDRTPSFNSVLLRAL